MLQVGGKLRSIYWKVKGEAKLKIKGLKQGLQTVASGRVNLRNKTNRIINNRFKLFINKSKRRRAPSRGKDKNRQCTKRVK